MTFHPDIAEMYYTACKFSDCADFCMREQEERETFQDFYTDPEIVNAAFSSAMTRSIPPQSAAYIIQVVQRRANDSVTIGRIMNVDRQNRSFTTKSDRNLSSVIQFNVPEDAAIWNAFGRPVNFSNLVPGLRVRVRHASFMTASIPPQTTAFEIRILR